jgi:YVTN family beta-propeller protein
LEETWVEGTVADFGLEFRILGPLEVRVDGATVQVGGPRQRALLTFLLLSANRVVSRDRLVEELMLDQPAAAANRTLTVQVSRLRKALVSPGGGGPRLVARSPGYVLRVEPGELDLDAFERLLAEGREARESGEPRRAAAALREADSLWRGRPLADLEFEPFARLEVERLAELRLAAIEERIEAELELGRHAALVPELEMLAADNPLRERLRGHLMVALYRCGRQADALEGYRVTRGLLAEELGLEPGPGLRAVQLAILRQDDKLELPPAVPLATLPPGVSPPPDASVPRRPRFPTRRRRLLPAGIAGAIVVAVVLALSVMAGPSGSTARPLQQNALVQVAGTGRLRAAVRLGATPTRIATGFGALWVTSFDGQSVARVDLQQHQVGQTIAVGSGPTGVAVGAGDVWVANSLDGTVSRIDPGTDRVVQTIAVGSRPTDVTFAAHSIWVANAGDDTISRLDPISGRLLRTVALDDAPTALTVGAGSVWAASETGRTVSQVDPSTGSVTRTVTVGGGPAGIAFGAGDVWVANSLDGTVSEIDPGRGTVEATVPVGNGAADVAAGPAGVWVSEEFGGRLVQINPSTSTVIRRVKVGYRPGGLALSAGGAWTGVRAAGPSHRGGTLRLLSSGPAFTSIDPAGPIVLQPTTLLGMTNDGLVTFKHVGGSDGTTLVPDLATSLPTPFDGGRTYTFTLRPGVRYSTGQPVRAGDVRESIERLFRLTSSGTGFYDDIVGSRSCRPTRCRLGRGIVTDDQAGTVIFHLVSPDPEFLYKLALPFAYVLPARSPMHDTGTRPLPATGPYMIGSYRPGHELRLVRNPEFHEWSNTAQPDGYANTIVWELAVPPQWAVTAVEHGQADWLLDYGALPRARRKAAQIRYAGQLHTNPALQTDYVVLNVRVRPFDDIRVRRALNFALNRAAAVQLYGGTHVAQPTCQVLPPQMPGYRRYCPYTSHARQDGDWSAPDLARARRLVSTSGTRGMAVTVLDTPEPIFRGEGQLVVMALRRLGYRASLHIVSDANFFHIAAKPRNPVPVISGGWAADYPAASDFIALKLSCHAIATGNNSGRFCDPAIDRQILEAEGRQLDRPQQAARLWATLDRELVDRAVWVPLVTPKLTDLVSRRVGNYQYHPLWGPLIDQFWVR